MTTNKIQSLIEKEIEAIRNIPIDGEIEKAIDLILNTSHKKSGKVLLLVVWEKLVKLATTYPPH